jgi:hypothetical protein
MFEFLKSTKTLEHNLRDWLVEDIVRRCGESMRAEAINISQMHERNVLEHAASAVMTWKGNGEFNRVALGKAQPLSEVLHWTKGLRLVNGFSKAKGWQITCSGSPSSGYSCKANECVQKEERLSTREKCTPPVESIDKIHHMEPGRGTKKDWAEVPFCELETDAKRGNLEAQTKLGLRYALGSSGLSKDPVEAMKWFRSAAEQGFAEAQYCLGIRYYDGVDVVKDVGEGIKWLHKAAEQGNAAAQSNLGVRYYYGEGVRQDLAAALKWWGKAAEQGDTNAQNNLDVARW